MHPVNEIPGLSALWEQAAGGDPAIRVAIIDGPVDFGHPSLRGANLSSTTSMTGPQPATVRSEHGTHVASVLMAPPGGEVLGVAPNCTASLFSIYRETEDGELIPSSQALLARAINQAVAAGAHLINISSGQLTRTGQAEHILADAVRNCAEAGALIVTAAGNEGGRYVHVPAALDRVLAVGACDNEGQPLEFSNFGDDYAANGILAPGQGIMGASPGGHAAGRSGTSFATPIVSGIAALLLSYLHRSGGEVDPQAVREALLASVGPCPANETGSGGRCLAGRLDVAAAARALDIPPGPEPAEAVPASVAGSIHPSQPTTIRESTMSDTPTGAAAPTTQLVGPDGQPLSAAVTPATVASDAGFIAAVAPSSQAEGAAMAEGLAEAAPAIAPVASQELAQPDGVAPAAAADAPPSIPPSPAPSALAPSGAAPGVGPSDADCGCVQPSQAAESGEKVFVIGRLYYDFGSEARLDYFVQAIAGWRDGLGGRGSDPAFGPERNKAGDQAAPYNPEIMARYLLNIVPGETASPGGDTNFPDSNAVLWTVTIDATPIYAIDPSSVFGWAIYASMIQMLWLLDVAPTPPGETTAFVSASEVDADGAPPDAFPPKGGVTRVSQAGHIAGSTRLMNGTVVPMLTPVWRGLYAWNLYDLLGPNTGDWPAGAQGFLERIYNEFRNVGISPQDRALNYSAMNAYNTKRIFAGMAKDTMVLDTVNVDRSTICRPDSDCWDVTYRFFNPTSVLTQARNVYQYTIDVSDVVPVPVGILRTWQVY